MINTSPEKYHLKVLKMSMLNRFLLLLSITSFSINAGLITLTTKVNQSRAHLSFKGEIYEPDLEIRFTTILPHKINNKAQAQVLFNHQGATIRAPTFDRPYQISSKNFYNVSIFSSVAIPGGTILTPTYSASIYKRSEAYNPVNETIKTNYFSVKGSQELGVEHGISSVNRHDAGITSPSPLFESSLNVHLIRYQYEASANMSGSWFNSIKTKVIKYLKENSKGTKNHNQKNGGSGVRASIPNSTGTITTTASPSWATYDMTL